MAQMRTTRSSCSWARDSLSRYVDSLIHSVRASYCRRDKSYASLVEVHEYFGAVLEDLRTESSLSSFLIARSHSSYLAAVTLLLGGQISDCYMLLRGCIENALYAFYLHNNPERVQVWVDRHKSETHLKACKKQFQMATIMKSLEEIDAKAKAYVGASYNRTIDRGAHPNMLSVFSLVKKDRKKNSFTFSYQSADKRVHQTAIYDTVHAGLVALTLVCVTFPKELDIPSLKKGIMEICKSTSAITRRCSRPVTPATAATVAGKRRKQVRRRRAGAPSG